MSETRAIFFDWGDTLVHYPGFDNDPEGHASAVERLFGWMRTNVKRQCFERIGMEWPAFHEAYNSIAAEHWAAIAVLPFAVATIAMLTARLTVMRTLARML